MIRVGRLTYVNGQMQTFPDIENYKTIMIMMKSHSKYWPLSPYYLKDSLGRNVENLWQFSKFYGTVPNSVQKYSRYSPEIIWEHPAENHTNNNTGLPNNTYRKWRKKGMNSPKAIRYPVGFTHRHNVKCSYAIGDTNFTTPLNYIEARKAIYFPIYSMLAENEEQFDELKTLLDNGQNLLIVEVDGPHQESMEYYKNKYNVNDDFIENNSILCTPENLKIILNDAKHPFGHGYCLAAALQNIHFD